MEKLCLFAGTHEGHDLASFLLAETSVDLTVCVATETGASLLQDLPCTVRIGRMNAQDMQDFFEEQSFDLLIDATHPYADLVTEQLQAVCQDLELDYLRIRRADSPSHYGYTVPDIATLCQKLNHTYGNILLTTGSKTLSEFCAVQDFAYRIFPRVLPVATVLQTCEHLGYSSAQIIALQGKSTQALNEALIDMYQIQHLVTKDTGEAGGFLEKCQAAEAKGIALWILGKPDQVSGMLLDEAKTALLARFGRVKKRIVLVGMGMGTAETLTAEAQTAIQDADILCGAERLLAPYKTSGKVCFPDYRPAEILFHLAEHPEYRKIAVLCSGDVGFYSVASAWDTLPEGYTLEHISGIATPVYFSARLGIPWQDMYLCSLHGRRENLLGHIKTHKKAFLLLDAQNSVQSVCENLCRAGFGGLRVSVGEKLSQPEERIVQSTAEALCDSDFDPLSCLLIENPNAKMRFDFGLPDEVFQRDGKTPMTKAEIRAVSLSKLRLSDASVVYDIGAGSGSVTVEIAQLVTKGRVYAIERKFQSLLTTERNLQVFGLDNVTCIGGKAPAIFADLPAPTHAFIGGSGGELLAICEALLQKNPAVRLVINCLSLDTLSQALSVLERLHFSEQEIISLTVARAEIKGNHHLMLGQNPIYIITCQNKEVVPC